MRVGLASRPASFLNQNTEMEKAIDQNLGAMSGGMPPGNPVFDLAVERTTLAHERTQLAWVRTVLGFITAGFAIDKGTAILHESRVVSGVAWSRNGHFAGLLLTITATVLMTVVTLLYIRRSIELNRMQPLKKSPLAPTALLSIFLCVVGGITIYFLNIDW